MELGNIAHFLENRTILVTGATGFLAKIFVEKIVRIQPNVKKLYLLVRAADSKSAAQRLHQEILGKELFRVVKEKLGTSLSSFVSGKLTPVPGDISVDGNLGVKDSDLREELWRETDVVVNLAATTNFDERYDVAMGINTMGAMHALIFAKKCAKIEMLIHVSTAYVAGERAGLIRERPLQMNEALNGAEGLDINAENKQIEGALHQLQVEEARDEASITMAMKDLGIKRARLYGWPNTYVFTKAMGEMLLGKLRGNLPVVIIRPTIITSTFKEPFPGWVEGIRTIDSLAIGYGKGKLTCFLGDPSTIIDAIPADMVANSMIVAMAAAAHARRESKEEVVYQVGSSVGNPVKYANIQDYGLRYFTKNPWVNKDGKAVKVGKIKVLSNMASFHRYFAIRYLILLRGLQLVNTAFCQYFQDPYMELNRKIKFVLRVVELYKPYLFFKGSFDNTNTEKLRAAAQDTASDAEAFYFDPKCIDWEDYFLNTHIPGVVKHVFK